AYTRTESYFPNSEFAAQGLPHGQELALLEPFRETLPKALFEEPFRVSKTDGTGNIRPQLQKAMAALKEAGWELQQGQLRHQETGQPFRFEILMQQKGLERVWLPYTQNLKRLGIEASLRLVDTTQYKVRL